MQISQILLAIESFVVGVIALAAYNVLSNTSPEFDPTTAVGQHQIVTALIFALLARLAAMNKITSKVTGQSNSTGS